jgi:hypothetical protein
VLETNLLCTVWYLPGKIRFFFFSIPHPELDPAWGIEDAAPKLLHYGACLSLKDYVLVCKGEDEATLLFRGAETDIFIVCRSPNEPCPLSICGRERGEI